MASFRVDVIPARMSRSRLDVAVVPSCPDRPTPRTGISRPGRLTLPLGKGRTSNRRTGRSDPEGAQVDEDLLTIGVFARRSWLSPKALRLYERQGLLLPAAVDEHNGYRWYREEQLETALAKA